MIITISRQVASNGELIGQAVAQRLGIRYIDRDLINELARRMHVDPTVVDKFDESLLNPMQSVLWEWLANVNEQAYSRALRQAFQRILAEGNSVVIGRGANFLIHCTDCLHVRIIAPLALRKAIYRASHDVSEREAEQLIVQGDRERAHFIHALFHEDIDAPSNYDLMLNLAGISPELATDLIVNAAQGRAMHPIAPETNATLPEHVKIMGRHRRPAQPKPVDQQDERRIA